MIKTYFILLMFLVLLKTQAQEKLYDYSFPLNCVEIKKGIVDNRLYNLIDGRVFLNERYDKSKIYKVIVNQNKSYYISKKLKKKIEKIVKKEKCTDITIQKAGTEKRVKLIRD